MPLVTTAKRIESKAASHDQSGELVGYREPHEIGSVLTASGHTSWFLPHTLAIATPLGRPSRVKGLSMEFAPCPAIQCRVRSLEDYSVQCH